MFRVIAFMIFFVMVAPLPFYPLLAGIAGHYSPVWLNAEEHIIPCFIIAFSIQGLSGLASFVAFVVGKPPTD